MVIVTTHAIAAFLLYSRNPERFLTDRSTHETPISSARTLQTNNGLKDFSLCLLRCGDVKSLGTTVKSHLCKALPGLHSGAVFYYDEETDQVFTADSYGIYVCSPMPECIKNVYKTRKVVISSEESVPQCITEHLPGRGGNISSNVGYYPICREDDGCVLAVLVVIGDDVSESTTNGLSNVIQQIAACYNHIQRTFHSTRPVEEKVSQSLIKLCGELYDQDAGQLQLKVLRYLEEQTQAECAFLLLVVPESQELFCQVIGQKILQEEWSLAGNNDFSVAIETKQPISLDDIPVESKKAIEEQIGCPLRSFLCVPVTSRSDNNLIALTCLANKQNTNRFTERDISCVRQCFRYTATVLTSTLAFQNERKLKIQTQALLTVARDLFTNLGELMKRHSYGVDEFPIIESRGCKFNVCHHIYGGFELRLRRTLAESLNKISSKTSVVSGNADDSSVDEIEKKVRQIFKDLMNLLSEFKCHKSFESSGKHDESKFEKEFDLSGEKHDRFRNDSRQYKKCLDWTCDESEKDVSRNEDSSIVYDFCLEKCEMDIENLRASISKCIKIICDTVNQVKSSRIGEDKCRSESVDVKGESFDVMDLSSISSLQNSVNTEENDKRYVIEKNDLIKLSMGGIEDNRLENFSNTEINGIDKIGKTHSEYVDNELLLTGEMNEETAVDTSVVKNSRESSDSKCRDEGQTLGESTMGKLENSFDTRRQTEHEVSRVVNVSDFPGPLDYQTPVKGDLDVPSICASASELSFRTAESETDDASQSTTDFFYSSDSLDAADLDVPDDITVLLSGSPDVFGFSEELSENNERLNRSECAPVHGHETLPVVVDSKPELNEEFCVEVMDDPLNDLLPKVDGNVSCADIPIILLTGFAEGKTKSSVFVSNQDVLCAPLSAVNVSVEDTKRRLSHTVVSRTDYDLFDETMAYHQKPKKSVCRIARDVEATFDEANMDEEPEEFDSTDDDHDVLVTVSDACIDRMQVPVATVGTIDINDLTKLLREIMQQARNLTNAERCSVFLIDPDTDELVAKVFDGITTNKDNEVQEEIRMPITQGIAGLVATSGELLNIKDAYAHPLFYRGIDDSTGFRTRNILCFPIKNEKGTVLGVAQLCNKKHSAYFTTFDEEIATAFGIYCCISISHSLMYKKLLESQHRKSLANELMIYHMQVSPDDVQGLSLVDIPHPRMLHPDFLQFSYAPRSLHEDRTLLGCLSMFEDLNLISRWRIRREALARFVLMVKRGYRNPPYHNWMHAYTVAQFCYQLIKNLKLEDSLDDIEMFALFVSCLCHDIDHRGTNNSFQNASKSVLAALYSSEGSVLERHHFAQTMCILNTEGCNVFEHLSSKEYQQVLDLMRDIILATDLAHHFKILKPLRDMAERGYDRSSNKDRKNLLYLLMTSCDLSDQTRPWDNTKKVAALIYKEFFSQGDMEKAKGLEPSDMYDRERAQIPTLQISFLDHVALPVYNLLGKVFAPAKEVADRVNDNKRHWEKISEIIKLRRGGSQVRMTFEEVLAIENEGDDDVEDKTMLPNGTG